MLSCPDDRLENLYYNNNTSGVLGVNRFFEISGARVFVPLEVTHTPDS